MNKQTEALKLALEALESERDKYLEWGDEDGAPDDVYEAITAIKQARSAPVQDIGVEQDERVFARIAARKNRDAAHRETAQRQWVGLTDEEANELWESTDSDWELMKRTEAKLRERNGG